MLKPRFHVAYQLPWLLCAWEVLGTLPVVYTFFTFYFCILYYLLFISLFFIYYFLLFYLERKTTEPSCGFVSDSCYQAVGRGVYFGVSQASHPKRAVFQRSPILGYSYMYAYTAERPNSAW